MTSPCFSKCLRIAMGQQSDPRREITSSLRSSRLQGK